MIGMGLVPAAIQELASIPNRGRLLDDDFTPTNRAAGAVDGTAPEPGPASDNRTVTDTGNNLAISGGQLNITGRVADGDPGLWYDAQSRIAGKVLAFQHDHLAGAAVRLGFDVNQGGPVTQQAIYFAGTSLRVLIPAQIVMGAVTHGQIYTGFIVLHNSGASFFVRGGSEFPLTSLVARFSGDVTASLFPGEQNATANSYDVNFFKLLSLLWLSSPLVSDGFGGAAANTDGLGHAEGVAGGIGSGGGEYLWTDNDGTWQNAAGICNASALSGGLAISTVGLSSADVEADLDFTSRAGGEGGLIIRYADSNNYLRAFHDGTNMQLEEVVAGVPNSLISVVTAFGAGNVIRIITDGTEYRLYYNNMLQGTTTGADASLQNNIRFGRYTTNTGNTFDNFVVSARGTANEHWPLVQMVM